MSPIPASGTALPPWLASLAREAVVKLAPYSSARSLVGDESDLIYLDANELGGFDGESAELLARRYPEPQPRALAAALASRYGVGTERLFMGAGADDAIEALIRVCCEARRDSILVTPPTYGYYQVAAAIQGAGVRRAPLVGRGFDLDERRILALAGSGAKLVFVCSPNNPTGNAFPPERLLELAKALIGRALLVVDEAYIEFSRFGSLAAKAGTEAPNLVVLRTLSKAYGLAGLRLGAAIAHPAVVELLHKVRAPYPISRPAAVAGAGALAALPPAAIASRVARVGQAREELAAALSQHALVQAVFPSEANFLLVETTDGDAFMARCRQGGVIVRDRRGEPGLAGCIRVSVGSPLENAALLRALDSPGSAQQDGPVGVATPETAEAQP